MEQKGFTFYWNCSLVTTLVVNLPGLLALRENSILAQQYDFKTDQLIFQLVANMIFCMGLLYLNLTPGSWLEKLRANQKYVAYGQFNMLMVIIAFLVAGFINRLVFPGDELPKFLIVGYMFRFGFSTLLIGIFVRIVLLTRETKKQKIAAEQLRTAYLGSELELLKAQMNPHFLFNSLSSLSGVIVENPTLAQKYLRHLSEVFRYALVRTKNKLVTVADELTMLHSFAQLITMRLENAFELQIEVDAEDMNKQLPIYLYSHF